MLLPYIESIDWESIKIASSSDADLAYSIEQQLLGDCDYLNRINDKFGLAPMEAELQVLRQWGKRPDMKRGPFNKYWHEHLAHLMKLLFPGTFVHPWLLDECWAVEMTISQERDVVNLIGSKSSGKSAMIARLSLALVAIHPTKTGFYIAAPYKNAAGYTVWGEVRSCFAQMLNAHPSLFPNAEYQASDQRCDFGVGFYRSAGFVELVGIDRVGKLQGIKSEDPNEGFLGVGVDEIGVFPSNDFMDILDNANGNANFLCVTGCNFRSIEGMEGKLCKPDGREYASLSMEKDHFWPSDYNSFTLRLDGHYQPNILAQRVLWIKLLQERKRKAMESTHGARGPKYLEQVRSFPNNSTADSYMTTRDKVQMHGGFDPVLPEGSARKVAFCDPGLGGDPCRFGICEFGPARVQNIEGEWRTMEMFRPVMSFQSIPLNVNQRLDQTWIDRLRKVSVNPSQAIEQIGEKVSLEYQIAVRCAELLMEGGVAKADFGYDGSMRASVVHAMIVIMGNTIHSVDFGGQASERSSILTQGKTAREIYYNVVTEMYFNLVTVIESGAMRGLEMVPAAVAQLCRRRWQERDRRRQVQPKTSRKGSSMVGYKEENQGRSPDDSDVLAGCVEIAIRKGFRPPLMKSVVDPKGIRNPLISSRMMEVIESKLGNYGAAKLKK